MNFFRLVPDCYLVEGARDGVLYDVTGNRLFLLAEAAHQILKHCEDNRPLSALENPDRARDFLRRLQRLGLGCFDSAPAYVDRLLLSAPVKGRLFERPCYRKVDWSIDNECDLNCYFCPRAKAGLSWQACQGCVRRPDNPESVAHPLNPEQTVDDIADLGTSVLHLRGGNPLLHWERLKSIMTAARRRNLLLVITTPGTGQDPERVVDLCSNSHVRLNVVVFGAGESSAKAACGRAGIYEWQTRLVHALKTKELPFFVTVLVCGATAYTKPEILNQARERWGIEPSFAQIYTAEEVDAASRSTYVGSAGKPLSGWHSPPGFYARVQWNTCLYGTFEISPQGLIHPCAGLDAVCGRTQESGLRAALATDSLYGWWQRNKETVDGCNRCALRLACTDCAAAEQAAVGRPELKSSYCPYNPDGEKRAYEHAWHHAGFAEFGVLSMVEEECLCQK